MRIIRKYLLFVLLCLCFSTETVQAKPFSTDGDSSSGPASNQSSGTGPAAANCGPAPLEDPSKSPDENKIEFLKWWDCIYRLSSHRKRFCAVMNCVQDVVGGITSHPTPTPEASKIMCNACENEGPYPEAVPNLPYRLDCLSDQVKQFIGPNNTGFEEGQYNCNDYASVADSVLAHCGWQVHSSFRCAVAIKPDGNDAGHQWLHIQTQTAPPICYAYDPFNKIYILINCE